MRPLLLKMKAFGSYNNETEINMDSFGSTGLYLITGATGSGKSTIINGIVYALYGKACDKEMMLEQRVLTIQLKRLMSSALCAMGRFTIL